VITLKVGDKRFEYFNNYSHALFDLPFSSKLLYLLSHTAH